jgi:FtsP/CotA-like multicopper oxidase with cupredoxin domain
VVSLCELYFFPRTSSPTTTSGSFPARNLGHQLLVEKEQGRTLVHDNGAVAEQVAVDRATLSWEKTGVRGTIMHVHGLTPPCNLDGVPYITAPPLFPGQAFHYRYQLDGRRNNGTYWAHSHYSFQACSGLAFPVVVDGVPDEYPLAPQLRAAQQQVVLLQDVCPSFAGDADDDHCSMGLVFAKLQKDWNQRTDPLPECPSVAPSTATDVAYEAHVANNRVASSPYVATVESADTAVWLRLINSGGMTNYLLELPAELNCTLVAVDGQWVVPLVGRRFWFGVAQRMDLLVQAPTDGSYPVVFYTESAEKVSVSVCVWFGCFCVFLCVCVCVCVKLKFCL